MIHNLRTSSNRIIVDACGTEFDINVTVSLEEFAKLYLITPKSTRQELVEDFEEIQDLRGELFEDPDLAEEPPDPFLERRLQEIGDKWDLHYRNDDGNTVGQQPHDPFPTEATRRAYVRPRGYPRRREE